MARRLEWVQAELRCLLCGRLLGRLAGAVRGRSVAVDRSAFSVLRPADSSKPVRRLHGHERFRCDVCSGDAIVDAIEHFTTWEELPQAPVAHRRGRPETPMRGAPDRRLVELGLAG